MKTTKRQRDNLSAWAWTKLRENPPKDWPDILNDIRSVCDDIDTITEALKVRDALLERAKSLLPGGSIGTDSRVTHWLMDLASLSAGEK